MTAEWTPAALVVFACKFLILGLSFGYLMGCAEGYRDGFKTGQVVQKRQEADRQEGGTEHG